VFPDPGEIISAGNFHGESTAELLYCIALAVHELDSMGERRTERLVIPGESLQEMSPFSIIFKKISVKLWRFNFSIMYQSCIYIYICQNVQEIFLIVCISNSLEDLGIDGRIILKRILKM
jgi:hypothetical protein